jgi:hypothetical protein
MVRSAWCSSVSRFCSEVKDEPTRRSFGGGSGFRSFRVVRRNETNVRLEVADETAESEWECSLSTSTYLVQHGRDYVNPNLVADRGWLHLEARYNYEAIKTGSLWLGYNFSFGKQLAFEVTPMFGGVFGDITGIAPGYTISISYEPIEFFTQGEYFFDAGNRSGISSTAGRSSVARL